MGKPYQPNDEMRRTFNQRRRTRPPLARNFRELREDLVPPSEPARTTGPNVPNDLQSHIRRLRQQFAGRSRLCLHNAETIVRIRRGIDLDDSLSQFFDMWELEADHLLDNLTSRWLISNVDTYADHGDEIERPSALMVSAMFNMLRFSETERLLSPQDVITPTRLPASGKLWDGVSKFKFDTGDTARNFIDRSHAVLSETPVILALFDRLLGRAMQGNTLLSRCATVNVKLRSRFPL